MTYPSKKDGWLMAVIVAATLVTMAAAVHLFVIGEVVGDWILAAVILFAGLWPWFLVLPVRYTIDEDSLHVQSGLLRWDISLERILEVLPTRNPLSSPALSLDRLKVTYRVGTGKRDLLISPESKEDFLAELVRREPSLVYEDGQLRRTAG